MKVSEKKKAFVLVMRDFYARYEVNQGERVGILEFADRVGVPRSQFSRWMTMGSNSLPGGQYAIRLVNFLYNEFGEEAFNLYDALDWDRPVFKS